MTPIWVLDTNVIISALFSSSGPPGLLLNAILERKYLQLAFDDRIEAEYKDVLFRKKFPFKLYHIEKFLSILPYQKKLTVPLSPPIQLPDPNDLPFLEVASLLNNPVLVTGNAKHFPLALVGNVKILSPREAWELLERRIEILQESPRMNLETYGKEGEKILTDTEIKGFRDDDNFSL